MFVTLLSGYKLFTDPATGTETFTEVPARLETVWLFPSILRGVAIYRGSIANADDEARDVARVYLEWERLDGPKADLETYAARQRKAMDKTLLRGLTLNRTDFSGARLHSVQLSAVTGQKAVFEGADMPKTVWITSLTKDETKTSALFAKIHTYGLATNGHFWLDDLEKMAWAGPIDELAKPDTGVWLLTGAAEDFAKPTIRQGLALLALHLAGVRGHGFPTLLCPFAGQVDPASLPMPLRGTEAVTEALLGAKLAAKANIPFHPEPADYRLRLYPMALYLLPDTPVAGGKTTGKKDGTAGGAATGAPSGNGTKINGGGATEEAQEQPFPDTEIARADGMTRINLQRLSSGSPVGGVGRNLIVLADDEGKYVTPTSPAGAYVLLPATTGKDFAISILIKNAFVLSDRTGRTDHFFLFRVNYQNGVKELYTTDITRPSNILYRNRYYISRSGPDMMGWTAATDYRPWNNALDFNEYRIVKEKNLLRFFFNGEFIRSERTMGDTLRAVKVDLREHERLYDIRVEDTTAIGPKHVHPWHTLGDAADAGSNATAPAHAERKQP